nr:AAA family ATPase [Clostridium sp. Marseille-Q2269]
MFLSSGLKDNTYLEKAVLTGILRVAKESIFSGLNNLAVSTILGYEYNDYFGFLDEEVEELLKYYNKQYEVENAKK